MYLNSWFKKWFIAFFICLAIILICGATLLLDSSKSKEQADPKYVINEVRLKVSGIMFYLERFHDDIEHDEARRETLLTMSKANDINLLFSQLDGSVIFNSSPEDKPIQKIDLKTALHYDLYTSKVEKDTLKIAFPAVDEESQLQIGNAIFTMPASVVDNGQANEMPLFRVIVMTSLVVILIMLLFFLQNKINGQMLQPIHKLKGYSEAILKGDYEQKAEYGTIDEIGGLYAVFEQMRMEMMFLSEQRAEQEKAQKELVTNISHDIKTPLTAIKAYIDAILDGVCPDMASVTDYVEVMQTNADKMAMLVEDLLLHALRELGQISVHLTEQYSQTCFNRLLNR